jgi:hypothetical protein
MTDAQGKLAWLSRVMAWLATIGAVAVPLVDIAIFLWPDLRSAQNLDVDHLGGLLTDAVPLPYRLGALVFALGAEAFTVWALWSLRILFLRYADGEVFSPAALRALNNVAVALFASVVVGFVMHAPISALLTWPLGHGHRAISLNFGSGDVATMFIAGVVLVIARVMNEAGRIAEENAKFV